MKQQVIPQRVHMFADMFRCVSGYIGESLDGKTKMPLPTLLECNVIPKDRSEIASLEVAQCHFDLKTIATQILPLDPQAPVLTLWERHSGTSQGQGTSQRNSQCTICTASQPRVGCDWRRVPGVRSQVDKTFWTIAGHRSSNPAQATFISKNTWLVRYNQIISACTPAKAKSK